MIDLSINNLGSNKGRVAMRGLNGVLTFLFLLVVCLGLVGCKEGVPKSELDQFVLEMNKLTAEAQDDSLRSIAASGNDRASFATYMIGNNFYLAASDSANLRGWGSVSANSLLDSAEVYLSAAVALDSTFLEAMVNLGSLWDDRSEQMSSREDRDSKVAKAESFYKMALSVDPLDEKARCNLGSLYLRQRRTQDAKAEFQKVLADNPGSSLAHYNMAIMFAEATIYREAIAEWELAVKHDPDGDIGQRSRDNIKIVKDLMNTPVPSAAQTTH
jgi:tetratricopeptide (TPR) repeat protein